MNQPGKARKQFDYGSLITGTLKLVLKHRFLWFFGILAGSGTSLGGWSCNYQGDYGDDSFETDAAYDYVEDWVDAHFKLLIALVIAAVVLSLLLWLWSIFCKGATVATVKDIIHEKPVSFRTAWSHGKQNFLRLLLFYLFLILIFLGISIIAITLIIFLVFAGITVSSFSAIPSAAWLLLIPLIVVAFIALAAISILFQIIIIFAMRAVIIDAERPVASLKRAWRLIEGSFGRTLLIFLLSVALSFAGNIIIAFALIIPAIPTAIVWIIAFATGMHPALIIIAALMSLLVLACFTIAIAAVNTYFAAYWTDTYMRFKELERSPASAHPR